MSCWTSDKIITGAFNFSQGRKMDKLTPEQRSMAMRHIHSKDTSIEIPLRKALWKKDIDIEKIIKSLRESQI